MVSGCKYLFTSDNTFLSPGTEVSTWNVAVFATPLRLQKVKFNSAAVPLLPVALLSIAASMPGNDCSMPDCTSVSSGGMWYHPTISW